MSNMKRMVEQSAADPQFIGFHADGSTFDPAQDQQRLGKQANVVFTFMAKRSPQWVTLAEACRYTGFPEASISARLRDFRKPRFGGHDVQRRRRKDGAGTWEYRLVVNNGGE